MYLTLPPFSGPAGPNVELGKAVSSRHSSVRNELMKAASKAKENQEQIFGELKSDDPQSILRNMLMMRNPLTQL